MDEPAASPSGAGGPATGRGAAVGTPSGERPAARDRTGSRAAVGGGGRGTSAGGPPPLIRPIGPPGRRRPTPLLIGAVLVALVLVVLAVRAFAGDGDGEGSETGPETTLNADTTEPPDGGGEDAEGGGDGETATDDTPTDDTTPDPTTGEGESQGDGDDGGDGETTGTTAATPTTAEPTPTTPPVGVTPPGWAEYTGGGGAYTIAHPAGWTVEQVAETRVQFRHPDNGTYLMVDYTNEPQPDPVADWRSQAVSFDNRHDNYQEIRIEPARYRDYNAAMWEFRYTAGGADLHVANLGFVAGNRGYALYFQTREANWASSQALYEQFQLAFRPG